MAMISAVLAVAANNMIVDLDLFHEMALYRQFLTEGTMPVTDDFAYTPTIGKVVHHEWATGAVLYWLTVSSGWGAAGLVGLKYILSFAVCFGCYFYARMKGASLATFSLLVPIALNLGGWMAFTNVRAQLFTLLFLTALFFLLELDRRGKRWWVWLWLPLFVVWANMHGGVVSGMGILAVYGLAQTMESYLSTQSVRATFQRIWHLLLVGLVTALLLNVNPYGWEYTPYLVRAVRMDRPLITEWSPLWKGASSAAILTFLISVAIAVYAVLKSDRRAIFESIALALTAYLAAKNLRHGSLYAVSWICLVPPLLETTPFAHFVGQLWKNRAPQLATIAIAISLVATGFAIQAKFWLLRVPAEATAELRGAPIYPVGAVEFLSQQKFQGNLFVPFSAGAFVSWKLYPSVRVSIDSRYEVAYPPGAVEENVAFYRAQNDWRAVLNKYETDAILVPGFNSVLRELQHVIRTEPEFGWKCVYKDDAYWLFLREIGQDQVTMVDQTGKRLIGIFP